MKTDSLTYAIILTAGLTLCHAETWNFEQTSALEGWSTLGKVEQTSSGLLLGPSSGSYAISGITSGSPTPGVGKRLISAKLTDFQVEVPAPDDLENENDIRVNIVLNTIPSGAWESEKAVVNVAVFYNSRHGGLFVGLYGKGDGFPEKGADLLTHGEFLGESLGQGGVNVELSIEEAEIVARFTTASGVSKELRAPMTDNLKSILTSPLYTLVYQQNIGDGSGSVTLGSLSAE